MEKRCKICGLPEYYTKIRYDENGVCNYCNFYNEHRDLLEDHDRLERVFQEKVDLAKERAAKANAKYDCLVGFSGGKDSTYIIYQMQKKYGMRVLAFTFQNGFSTEYARKNIENALSKLDVDHITFSMNEEELRKQYTLSVNFLHNFCSVCFHFMHYYSFLLAGQHKIPLIVNGRTKGQIYQCADSTHLMEPFETSKSLLEFEHQMFHGLEQKLHARNKVDYLDDIQAEAVSYFAYHDISEEETMRFLEEKIGWMRSKGASGHNDCFAHGIAENMSMKKRGHPIRLGELAVEVRRGRMTIEEMDEILAGDRSNFTRIDEESMQRFQNRIQMRQRKPGGKS